MDTLIKSGLWILVYFDLICPQHDALYFAIISYNHLYVSNEKVHIKLCLKVPLNLTFLKYFQQIKLSILPCCCSCQPMELLSNLSSQVLVIIIKSQEKIKPVIFFSSGFQS